MSARAAPAAEPDAAGPTEAAVLERVRRWHNRQPLAIRIAESDVQGVGVVALPFVAPAQGKRGAGKPSWDEDFVAPLSARRVRRWAARHAAAERPLPKAPLREVAAAGAGADVTRYAVTAALEHGGERVRVLLSPDLRHVLGARLMARPRVVGAVASLGTVLLAAGIGAGWWFGARDSSSPLARRAASAAVAASAPAAAQVASAAQPAPPAVVALQWETPPSGGRVVGRLVSSLSEEQRAALRQSGETLRALADTQPAAHAPAHPAPQPAASAAAGGASAAPPGARAAAHPTAPADDAAAAVSTHWALVTPGVPDKSRAERAQAQLHAVALLQPQRALRVELMRAGGGWRVVLWPLASEAEAAKLRIALADKGLETAAVAF